MQHNKIKLEVDFFGAYHAIEDPLHSKFLFSYAKQWD